MESKYNIGNFGDRRLKSIVSSFIHWYNEERLHSPLKYKTPMEILEQEKKAKKMTDFPIYGYVGNSNELPTYPQIQLQPLL